MHQATTNLVHSAGLCSKNATFHLKYKFLVLIRNGLSSLIQSCSSLVLNHRCIPPCSQSICVLYIKCTFWCVLLAHQNYITVSGWRSQSGPQASLEFLYWVGSLWNMCQINSSSVPSLHRDVQSDLYAWIWKSPLCSRIPLFIELSPFKVFHFQDFYPTPCQRNLE